MEEQQVSGLQQEAKGLSKAAGCCVEELLSHPGSDFPCANRLLTLICLFNHSLGVHLSQRAHLEQLSVILQELLQGHSCS